MEQIDNTTRRIVNVLSDVCAASPRLHHARVAAAIVHQRKIVSVGTNNGKSDPWQARFSKDGHGIWVHAEIQAIKRAHARIGEEALTKSTLYVCRLVQDHDLVFSKALSKPCAGCRDAITKFGIKRVVYTTGVHGVVMESF